MAILYALGVAFMAILRIFFYMIGIAVVAIWGLLLLAATIVFFPIAALIRY